MLEFNDLAKEPAAALFAEVDTNLNQVSMTDLLIGITDVTNISTSIILQDSLDTGWKFTGNNRG